MFKQFAHRHSPCTVNGTVDVIILSRENRGTAVIGKEYMYNGVFAQTSPVKPGDLIDNGDWFFVQTLRPTTEKDKYCSLVKTNATITVNRFSQEYDSNDNPIGSEEYKPIAENVIAFAQYVTARLRQDDPGLLPSTTYTLQLQTTVDIKDPQDAIHPDQVILKGKAYQVDAVDVVKYPNLLHVQLSDSVR
ncbi:hypothetical protein [Paenibacillus sp. P46E]|uniref:hypothetical protein n=1 Tax=Paenibacillus sp. P46E TaxID=1349436 RepID=UPI00093EA15F|nr:hypothetical protein [Paenibacillus sp. P46E]OKP95389.1 hypothetical protein A3849_26255 [Paenibacillus sp. P46E]